MNTFAILRNASLLGVLVLSGLGGTQTAYATELIYVPVNPAFGGNPLNGPVLLNNALAQNDRKDPDAEISSKKSSLDQFNETLQRSILSRLASAASGQLVVNNEIVPGAFKTDDFEINIVPLGGGVLEITTTDLSTGQTTSFRVQQ